MASIKFDSTEILNTTYIPRYVKHESAPERALTLLELAREDGSILVAEKYGTKTITLIGYLVGTSKSDLETKIDSFKELFSRKEKNLDIDWESGTRRYVATCVRHNFDRDHFHLLFVPWTAEFIVVEGIGKEITETHLLDINDWVTENPYTGALTFVGSAKPKPRLIVRIGGTSTQSRGLKIENTDTGERMVVNLPEGFTSTYELEVDCDKKTVKYNSIVRKFYGLFMSWIIGVNNWKITLGRIIDQFFEGTSPSDGFIYKSGVDYYKRAQLFMVSYTDETYQVIQLRLKKRTTPTADLVVKLCNDLNGLPDETNLVKDENTNDVTFNITQASLTTSYAWYSYRTAVGDKPFTLEAGKRYWILLMSDTSTLATCYDWAFDLGVTATYKRGHGAMTSPTTWLLISTSDYWFKIEYGANVLNTTGYIDVYYYKRYL